jgi:HK97 family phage portal protein
VILHDGVLVKSARTLWEGTTNEFNGWSSLPMSGGFWQSYAEIYRRQLWVAAVINKLAMGEARLPLKVYRHGDLNRPEARDDPYYRLLRRPNSRQPRFFFWLWTVSTFDVFGEAFWGKVRDKGGQVTELALLHPTAMRQTGDINSDETWNYDNGRVRIDDIPRSELVHFKTFNPETQVRGMSRLEPLRRTLEFEDAAQRAQSAFWANGARPGVLLSTDRTLSQSAQDRLRLDWNAVAGGVDKTGKTIVLEEGLKPEKWALDAEESQYIESRKLNREEVCAAYDVPPPAVGILDRATFSNITEQLRSLYRDTHAPRLQLFESTLEAELRGSVRPGASEPDFSDEVYAEFLLDEVLRGDFEARAAAFQQADFMTLAEKRQRENLPFIAGTDRIFVNAATVPLESTAYNTVGSLVRSGYDPESALEALGLDPIEHSGALPVTVQPPRSPVSADQVRSLMGRLSRVKGLDEIDADHLVADLDPDGATLVSAALSLSLKAGHSVAGFRDRIKRMAGDST